MKVEILDWQIKIADSFIVHYIHLGVKRTRSHHALLPFFRNWRKQTLFSMVNMGVMLVNGASPQFVYNFLSNFKLNSFLNTFLQPYLRKFFVVAVVVVSCWVGYGKKSQCFRSKNIANLVK